MTGDAELPRRQSPRKVDGCGPSPIVSTKHSIASLLEWTAIEGVVPPLNGLLFVGTATNINDPAGTLNDVFRVDPSDDTSASILTGVQVWGATADEVGLRVLYTRASGLTPPVGEIGGGDELFLGIFCRRSSGLPWTNR